MIRIIAIITFFLMCFYGFAQIKSGQITYSVSQNSTFNSINKDVPISITNSQKKIENIITTLKFTLLFNQRKAVFKLDESLPIELNDFYTKMATLAVRGNHIFYTDLNLKFIIDETNFLDEIFLVKHSLNSFQWNLTNETKLIGDYLCYKAESLQEIINPKTKIKKDIKHTVWYCPELPLGFGPYMAQGLPGIVLEYSTQKLILYATNINLNIEPSEIIFPQKGKIVTQTEYNEIRAKAYKVSN